MQKSTTVSRGKIIAKWGLIMAIPLFLVTYGAMQIAPTSASEVSMGTMLIGILSFAAKAATAFLCMFFAAKEWRDNGLGGFISYGQGYVVSLFTGFAAAFILLAFSPLTVAKHVEQVQNIKETQMDKMDQMGASDDEVEIMDKVMDLVASPALYYIGNLFGNMFYTAIMALITAAVAQKAKPIAMQQQELSQ